MANRKPVTVVTLTAFNDADQLMATSSRGNGISEMDWCRCEQEYRALHGEEAFIVVDNKGRCALGLAVK